MLKTSENKILYLRIIVFLNMRFKNSKALSMKYVINYCYPLQKYYIDGIVAMLFAANTQIFLYS
jgi:hypothetical protein